MRERVTVPQFSKDMLRVGASYRGDYGIHGAGRRHECGLVA